MKFDPPIGDEHMRALGCGLAGAHRVGKSLLAQRLHEVNKCPLIVSAGGPIARLMGIEVRVGMPMAERLAYQEAILRVSCEAYATQNGLFLTDRTPLDFAAYAILDWKAGVDEHLDVHLSSYIERCLDATNRYFFHIGVIQPGIPYVEEPGKPAPNPLYQELLNTTIIGLTWDDAVNATVHIIPRGVTDLRQRIDLITHSYSSEITGYRRVLGETLAMN
jgi:hypothetical protein